MKKIVMHIVLIGLLSSLGAAKSGAPKSAKGAKPEAATGNSTKSFDGWISDERCGTKVNAACSKICQKSGAKLVFVGSDNAVTPVANQESVNPFVGQHVTVQGKLENGVLTVSSVKAAGK
jgi:GTP cyclohydrolase III